MRTTDRYGNAQSSDDILRGLGNGSLEQPTWDIRLINTQGQWTTPSAWLTYTIPPAAMVRRERKVSLDDMGTGSLKLSIAAAYLPAVVSLQQYDRIEVDRCFTTSRWPYFTGVILSVVEGYQVQRGGAVVQTYEIDVVDVLHRAKGYYVPYYAIEPIHSTFGSAASTSNPLAMLTGMLSQQSGSFVNPGPSSTTVGMATACWAADSTSYFDLATDAAFQNIVATANYTATRTNSANAVLTIATGASFPTAASAPTIYWRAWVPQFFGFSRAFYNAAGSSTNYTPQAWFRVPQGRDTRDLYQTTIAAFTTGASPTVTPADTPGYGAANLDLTQGEYLLFTDASGKEEVKKITAVNGAILTLDAAFSVVTPYVGMSMHLCTTETFEAWDELGSITSIYPQHGNILFASNNAGTAFYERRVFTTKANMGIAIANAWAFGSADAVYLVGNYVAHQSGNAVDSVIAGILGTSAGLGLFNSSHSPTDASHAEIVHSFAGLYQKSQSWHGLDLMEMLKDFKKSSLPPNAYIRADLAGTVSIQPYTQLASPAFDWTIVGPTKIQAVTAPEPINAVVVFGKDDTKVNMAPTWLSSVTGYRADVGNGPAAVADLQTATYCQAAAGQTLYATFTIPVETPRELYPQIDDVEVYGSGFLSAYVVPHGPSSQNGVQNWIQVNTSQSSAPGTEYSVPVGLAAGNSSTTSHTIPGEAIAKARALQGNLTLPEGTFDLVIVMAPNDTTSTDATIAEVVINVQVFNGWRAALTDDATDMPSGWKPSDATQNGSIWAQPYCGQGSGAAGTVTVDPFGNLTSPTVTAGGSGYVSDNSVVIRIEGGGGSGSWATPTVSGGAITGFTLQGATITPYATAPAVIFQPLSLHESYRYVPTSYAQRALTLWASTGKFDQRFRTAIYEIDGIGPQQARRLAELYCDEHLRRSQGWKVTSVIFDPAELGDTVLLPMPDGSIKETFLWAIEDSGGPTDDTWSIDLIDYSS